ncbi:HD family phosphohydrolase [Vaginisenegalia massiliensis]|uniref:HD family phosphohydrolase n=1 Tax=Vaginisenegalia massiliensis TaxID=2058294 RepID=UPI000F51F1B6|nr:HDIG domain-containing metalloprotein [Vaginisenegalia massiliensis]
MNRQLQNIQMKLRQAYVPLLLFLMAVVLISLGYSKVQPKQYDFKLNQVSPTTIRAPRTLEDVEITKLNQQRAKDNVKSVYVFQPDIRENQLTILEQYFGFLRQIRKEMVSTEDLNALLADTKLPKEITSQVTMSKRKANQKVLFGQLNDSERLLVYHGRLSQMGNTLQAFGNTLTDKTIAYLLRLNETELTTIQTEVTSKLSDHLNQEISDENVTFVLEQLDNAVLISNYEYDTKQVLIDFYHQLIVPTSLIDQKQTDQLKTEAVNKVQPTYILQGQVIVQEGHVVDQTNLRQLTLFGFTKQRGHSIITYAFIALVIGHSLVVFYYCHRDWASPKEKISNQIKMKVTAYVVVFILMFVGFRALLFLQETGTSYASLLLPIALMPFMLVPKIKLRLTLISLTFFNLMALFLLNGMDKLTDTMLPSILYFLSSLIALIVMRHSPKEHLQKEYLIHSLIWHLIFVVPFLVALNINLVTAEGFRIVIFIVSNVIFTHLIYLLFNPYWEQLLSDRAPMTLNQLANLNHPLLKLIIEKAPGTYHHSILVANLAANAVEQIGGDSLLTRVASYYHDVGKTVHPLFFVENLPSGVESPHRMVDPYESANIIIGHVTLGQQILNEHNMPQSIIDICMQHHGTTLVQYFYTKAKEDNPDVDRELFQYPGPKPQTKEAAIIMIADSIEAASRTLKDYNQESIEQLVNKIIDSKMEENQFEMANLTVHELQIAKKSLIKGVASMYHTRIEYPE